jgi:hypothetical protein|tara:strand:- start:202 stop:327 length:126 start_codon:yes stop_codon:yes gene_type:complete
MNDYEMKEMADQLEGIHQLLEVLLAGVCEDGGKKKSKSKKE